MYSSTVTFNHFIKLHCYYCFSPFEHYLYLYTHTKINKVRATARATQEMMSFRDYCAPCAPNIYSIRNYKTGARRSTLYACYKIMDKMRTDWTDQTGYINWIDWTDILSYVYYKIRSDTLWCKNETYVTKCNEMSRNILYFRNFMKYAMFSKYVEENGASHTK